MGTTLNEMAMGTLKNMAEMDSSGDLIFKGKAIEIIQAINEASAAEMRLAKLLQEAITIRYDDAPHPR